METTPPKTSQMYYDEPSETEDKKVLRNLLKNKFHVSDPHIFVTMITDIDRRYGTNFVHFIVKQPQLFKTTGFVDGIYLTLPSKVLNNSEQLDKLKVSGKEKHYLEEFEGEVTFGLENVSLGYESDTGEPIEEKLSTYSDVNFVFVDGLFLSKNQYKDYSKYLSSKILKEMAIPKGVSEEILKYLD